MVRAQRESDAGHAYPPIRRRSTATTLPSPTSSSSTIAASTISMRPSRSLACFHRSAQKGHFDDQHQPALILEMWLPERPRSDSNMMIR
jgi:hypothetical protein